MGLLGLRVTDQETARVVAIFYKNSTSAVGAGCLVSSDTILTCRHVVEYAVGKTANRIAPGAKVEVVPIGLTEPHRMIAQVERIHKGKGFANDLALLSMRPKAGVKIEVPTVEFATPLRHAGKSFHVMGFPGSNAQGRQTNGTLHAADAYGLVQMDSFGRLLVRGGFSGAPVWSPEVNAFIGIVVAQPPSKKAEADDVLAADLEEGIAWCIPSRLLCNFYKELPVRFRMPEADRPHINDRDVDDPNVQIFGQLSDNGKRRLTATVKWRKHYEDYKVSVTYKVITRPATARGKYVTFITYPDFKQDDQDAYELFAELDQHGIAYQEFYPDELFTVAAIGDAGDTALTLDLEDV